MTSTDLKPAAHPSSDGHWYDPKTLTQVVTVEGAKGQQVRPDIRHARKLGLYPGKTAIISQLAKPGLDKWKKRQAVLAALTLPRTDGELEDAWLERVYADADATAEKAAEEGTRRHAAVQTWYASQILVDEHAEQVLAVRNLLDRTFGPKLWYSERVVAHPIGAATKIDLDSSPGRAGNPMGPPIVLDIKSKEGDQAALDELKLYDENYMELALGVMSIEWNGATAAILYISRTHPTACRILECQQDKLEHGWQMFTALHRFWCVRNRYNPAQEK